MIKVILNTNKTELMVFSRDNSDSWSIFWQTKFSQQKKSCTYLGIQIDGES